MELSVFKLIVNQLFDMCGFNFSRLLQAQIYSFSRLLGCCAFYNAENQEFLSWDVAVLSPAHQQKRQQAEGYAHEVGLHVAGAEAVDVE